ncbi:MAG TPA: hypothetical protein DCE80_14385 [Ignavibacteriales bacterium]|nr:hypothetical protein [Ignavibacteriales bacterium]
MGEILDNLVSEISQVEIKGKKYLIGKITSIQVIKLARYIVKFTSKINKEKEKLLKEGNSNIEDVLTFFDFLNEDEIAGVLGILLNETDTEFLKNIPIETLTEIIAVICEQTDIKKILGNVQRITESMKK